MKLYIRVLSGTPKRDIGQVLRHRAIVSWARGGAHNSEGEAHELLGYFRDCCDFSDEQIERAMREIAEHGSTELESDSLVEADVERGLQWGEKDVAEALIAAARNGR
jgi:hypothetical protein